MIAIVRNCADGGAWTRQVLLRIDCRRSQRRSWLPLYKFRKTKIQNFRMTRVGDEDVGWLYIPVDDTLRMSRIKSVNNFDGRCLEVALESGLAKDPETIVGSEQRGPRLSAIQK
jgi:hypothetical protein